MSTALSVIVGLAALPYALAGLFVALILISVLVMLGGSMAWLVAEAILSGIVDFAKWLVSIFRIRKP